MPAVLRLDSISFSFHDAVPLLVAASCEFHRGWTALVAPNGAGKTTVLRLLHRELFPDEGHITVSPRHARVAWCRQRAEECTNEIEALVRGPRASGRRWLGRLRLEAAQLNRWPTLSPGERRRWQVAAALATKPDILLLDEPTDHLDGDAREILLSALRAFEGVGILVSHDRALLGALATTTVRLHQGKLDARHCSFEEATHAWENENETNRRTREKLRREDRKLRRRLGQRKNDLRSADASVGRRKRSKGRGDSESRSMAASIKAQRGAARLSRESGVLRDQLKRQGDAIDAVRFDKVIGGDIRLAFRASETDPIAGLHQGALLAGSAVVVRDISLDVHRHTRAWIEGPNGSGKSTLLRALRDSARLPDARVLHLPQELEDTAVAELMERLHSADASERGRLLSLAATLGADAEHLLGTESPSPGEARKLWLAEGLARGVAACLLDEPTNHLDLPAIGRLEAALAAYPGALVLVSHDPVFGRACTEERWTITDGRIQRR